MRKLPILIAGVVVVAAVGARIANAVELPANDYPTYARADYVFACMQTNGQTRDALEKCSCSIDQIAAILPFAEYEQAETIYWCASRAARTSRCSTATRRCWKR